LRMFRYRVRKYIGAYAAAMGGVDVVVFTGGIGENSENTRYEVAKDLEYLGLEFDKEKNTGVFGQEKIISKENSRVVAMVIPTDEELVIAQDTEKIIESIVSKESKTVNP